MGASAILKLQKVGFTVEQVEALSDFMDTQAASKADLAGGRSELKADIAAVKADLAEVKSELKADLAGGRSELKADIAEVKADMKLLEHRLTIKLGGMLVVVMGILLAAIRYLPPHP